MPLTPTHMVVPRTQENVQALLDLAHKNGGSAKDIKMTDWGAAAPAAWLAAPKPKPRRRSNRKPKEAVENG